MARNRRTIGPKYTTESTRSAVLRKASNVMRATLQQRMINAGYKPKKARKIASSPSVLTGLVFYGASRVAARSAAGLAVIGGGFLAKKAYDRHKSKAEKPDQPGSDSGEAENQGQNQD